MNKLVSVIVPIYKVENYLKQCVDSLICQKYSNLEVILVDDGSPDGCGKICDEYKEKDSRIIVIHKENGGISSARNAGLEIAKGEYIVFIDSDDYVSDSFIYEMVEEMEKSVETDLIITSYYNVYSNDGATEDRIEKSEVLEDSTKYYTGKEIINNRFGKQRIPFVLAWNKLYKRKLFNKVCYKEGAVREDEIIFRSIMEQCERVAFINKPLIFHRIRSGSIMTSYSKINVICNMEWMTKEIEYYKSQGVYEQLHILEHMMSHEYVKNSIFIDNELKMRYLHDIKSAMKDLCHAKDVKIKTRIHYRMQLFKLSMGL